MRCPTLSELPPPPPGKTGWPWTEESPQLPETMPDGSSWPRVSIVTPSYNQAQFIEETIRSVLLQGYPNLEYIIIDGGSTDSSVGIIKKYEPWLSYWVSEVDRGQAEAVNKGWRRARGEILAYLNSDDTYLPQTVETVVSSFHEHQDVGMVYGDCNLIDEEGETIGPMPGEKFTLEKMLWRNVVPQPAAFIRRSVLERVGLLDENLHHCMDYDLWLRIALHFPVKHIPTILANFRLHSSSKTIAQQGFHLAEMPVVLEKLFLQANCPPHLLHLKDQSIGYAHWIVAIQFWLREEEAFAKQHARQAAELYPEFIHSSYLLQQLSSQAIRSWSKEAPSHVKRFFDYLAGNTPGWRRARVKVLGRTHALLAVEMHKKGVVALDHVLKAGFCDPSWFTERHTFPLLLEGFIGAKAMNQLRRVKRCLLPNRAVGGSLS